MHLGHLRTLLRLFSLLLVQESKRAKIVGQMMQHPALLAQLCAVAGGRGQCNEQLQEGMDFDSEDDVLYHSASEADSISGGDSSGSDDDGDHDDNRV